MPQLMITNDYEITFLKGAIQECFEPICHNSWLLTYFFSSKYSFFTRFSPKKDALMHCRLLLLPMRLESFRGNYTYIRLHMYNILHRRAVGRSENSGRGGGRTRSYLMCVICPPWLEKGNPLPTSQGYFLSPGQSLVLIGLAMDVSIDGRRTLFHFFYIRNQ